MRYRAVCFSRSLIDLVFVGFDVEECLACLGLSAISRSSAAELSHESLCHMRKLKSLRTVSTVEFNAHNTVRIFKPRRRKLNRCKAPQRGI